MSKILYPRNCKHSYNTACFFIDKVFGEGVTSKIIGKNNGFDVYTFYKDGEMIGFYDESTSDLWTTVK